MGGKGVGGRGEGTLTPNVNMFYTICRSEVEVTSYIWHSTDVRAE